VAFRVRDIHAAFDYLKRNGFQLIDAAPRPGSRGTTVFFMHPKSRAENPFGYLIEVVQDPRPAA
jgi:methylmalonyl-CoA/ethylmalonyl-CoA epimerase